MTRATMPTATTRASTTIDPAMPATRPRSRSVEDWKPKLLVGLDSLIGWVPGVQNVPGLSAQYHACMSRQNTQCIQRVAFELYSEYQCMVISPGHMDVASWIKTIYEPLRLHASNYLDYLLQLTMHSLLNGPITRLIPTNSSTLPEVWIRSLVATFCTAQPHMEW